jgi:hypothetical protein
MKELSSFDGHLVLYCKKHYSVPNVDLILGLQRMIGVYCGNDAKDIAKRHILTKLSKIVSILYSDWNIEQILSHVHEAITNKWYEDLSVEHKLIVEYVVLICHVQTKQGRKILVKLPKPQKRLFKRIIRGNGNYNDYKLIL